MSKTTQPKDEIAGAEQATAEAERRVGEIEQSLLDGDASTTAADLVQAEQAAEQKRGILARARDIVKRKAEIAAEERRVARIAELRTEFGDQLGDELLDAVVAKFDAAVAELTDMARQVVAYNDVYRTLVKELAGLKPLPSDVRIGHEHSYVQFGWAGDSRQVDPVDVGKLAAEAMLRAVIAVTGKPLANAEQTVRYALSHDPNGRVYGIGGREKDGAQLPWGLSDVIRWRSQGCPDHGWRGRRQGPDGHYLPPGYVNRDTEGQEA